MKAVWLLPSLAAAALLAGCNDSFTPTELAGVYRLTAVQGTPPPYLELATIECDQFIVDGTLVLVADGSHDLSLVISLECPRGGDQVGSQRTYPGTFTISDDELEFVAPGSSEGDIVFGGQARERTVILDLPSTVGADPVLQLRFVKEVCPDICPA